MAQDTLSAESHAVALGEATGEMTLDLGEITSLQAHPMAVTAAQMGFGVAFGTAAFVGRNAANEYLVQFNDQNTNTGYSSAWPAWAYEVAKSALENGKQLLVGANGDPFGSNLVFVLELA
jgi:hypothetical protein